MPQVPARFLHEPADDVAHNLHPGHNYSAIALRSWRYYGNSTEGPSAHTARRHVKDDADERVYRAGATRFARDVLEDVPCVARMLPDRHQLAVSKAAETLLARVQERRAPILRSSPSLSQAQASGFIQIQ